jgi:hypothetical protein
MSQGSIKCRQNTKVCLHRLHRAAWEGTLEEAVQSEISEVLVGEITSFMASGTRSFEG